MADSIDITDLVNKSKSAFVDWAITYIFSQAILVPGLQWLAIPVISDLVKFIVRKIVGSLADSAVMQAFFLNTALRKATQAKDFVAASNALDKVPSTASQEEYKLAEQNRMAAFRNFVMVSN